MKLPLTAPWGRITLRKFKRTMNSFFDKRLWGKELVAWYFYDFANSIFVINASLYFSQWITIDRKLTDLWFGAPFILGTAALVFISPYFGELGDRNGAHRKILIIATLFASATAFGVYLSGRMTTALFGVVITLIFYTLFEFLYQLALVPYSAFMKLISTKDIYGKVSGLGFSFNQLGYIFGILLTYPILKGHWQILGSEHLAPLFPSAIAFLAFAIPAMVLLRSKPVSAGDREMPTIFGTFFHNLRLGKKHPGLVPFVFSFYLWSDAILALTLYGAIYLQQVFNAPDASKANIYLIIIAADVVGAFLGGFLSDKIGHKRVLLFSLIFTAASILAIAVAQSLLAATILFPTFGLGMGLAYASSRSYFATLFPDEESGRFFGLYTFAERAASVIGPLLWGVLVFAFANQAPFNYRVAAFGMGLLVVAGIIPLLRKTLILK